MKKTCLNGLKPVAETEGVGMLLDKIMTKDEQKILLFIVIIGFIGVLSSAIPHFATSKNAQLVADSLKTELAIPTELLFDINIVTVQQLASIKGIGQAKAEDMIAYRDANRPIKLDDLSNVRGIGAKTIEKLRPYFFDSEVNISVITATTTQLIEIKKMNINDAKLSDLTRVKGIGEKKGEAIINFLQESGRIKNIDQLLEVKGVGTKILGDIKEHFYGDEN